MTTVQDKPPPPPPKPQQAIGGGRRPSPIEWAKSKGRTRTQHRVGIYGPGGIGKSTLASLAMKPRFLDLESGTVDLDVERIEAPDNWTWPLLRQAVQQDDLWETCGTVIIDTATAAEELCCKHVLGTVPKYEGQTANWIEDYGYGKGYVYVYEEFTKLLADLDAHLRNGRNVALIMHDITAKVPNPIAEDFIRFEPRLQASGKASIRHRVREWLDHLVFVGYDIAVNKDGKAKGSGSRFIYPRELPWAMAKSRTLTEPVTFNDPSDASLWDNLIPKGV